MLENAEQEQAKETKIFGVDVKDITETVKMLMENKDQAKEIVGIFAPIIGEVIDLTLDTIGPEAHKVILRVALGSASVKKAVFDQHIKNKFTRKEAMMMILSDAKAVDNIGRAAKTAKK